MGITKYSLLCKNGYLFHTDTHILIMGEWVNFSYGYTILAHGILSEEEARQIMGQTLVNLYQDTRNKTVTITAPYHEKYLSRNDDRKTDLSLYAGCLKRQSERVWEGRVHIK